MICPRCKIPMTTHLLQNVPIDECSRCKGIWFDKDELRKCKDRTDPDLNWMDFELWKHKDRFHLTARAFPCPRCNISMVKIEYDQTGVEIDHCPQCKGIWLDKGEFPKIIEILTDELLTKSVSGYLKASLQEARELITGPEGFISEWRDFLTALKFLELRFFVENPRLSDAVTNFQKNNPIR